jgi:hypothetical protein
VVNNGSSNKLLRNHAASSNHWVEINLRGRDSNRSAIGARVRVKSGSLSQIREVEGASGLRSQNSSTPEFGLGATAQNETLTVWWPSGTVKDTVLTQVDQVVSMTECATSTPTPNASSMAAWVESNPNPGYMTLHFSFTASNRADAFKVYYRLEGQSTWTQVLCDTPGTNCMFNCDATYEATVAYTPCDLQKFYWYVQAHNCAGWSSSSTTKSFTAYCLEEL